MVVGGWAGDIGGGRESESSGGWRADTHLGLQLHHGGLHLRIGLVQVPDLLVQLLDLVIVVQHCPGTSCVGGASAGLPSSGPSLGSSVETAALPLAVPWQAGG